MRDEISIKNDIFLDSLDKDLQKECEKQGNYC
jgi:hypothetical protein